MKTTRLQITKHLFYLLILCHWLLPQTAHGAARLQVTGGERVGDRLDYLINNGDTSPSVDDGTDLGTAPVRSCTPRITFICENLDVDTTMIVIDSVTSSNPLFRFTGAYNGLRLGDVTGQQTNTPYLHIEVYACPEAIGVIETTITITATSTAVRDIVFTFVLRATGETPPPPPTVTPPPPTTGNSESGPEITVEHKTGVAGENTFTEIQTNARISFPELGPVTRFRAETILISNRGDQPLNLSYAFSENASGAANDPGYFLQNFPATLAPRAVANIVVGYHAHLAFGSYPTTLVITNNDTDDNESPFRIRFHAAETYPAIGVDGYVRLRGGPTIRTNIPKYNHGNFENGTQYGQVSISANSVSKQFSITNRLLASHPEMTVVNAPLKITDIRVIQGRENYSIASGRIDKYVANSAILLRSADDATQTAATAIHHFTINYNPETVGRHSANVRIQTDDPLNPSFYFSLRGEGVMIPDFEASGNPLLENQMNGVVIANNDDTPSASDGTVLGQAAVRDSLSRTFVMLNTGDWPLTITATSSNRAFTISGIDNSIPLDSISRFSITFRPRDGGLSRSLITLASETHSLSRSFMIEASSESAEITVEGGKLSGAIADGERIASGANGTLFPDIGFRDSAENVFAIRNNASVGASAVGSNQLLSISRIQLLPGSGASHFRLVLNPGTATLPTKLYPIDARLNPSVQSFSIIFEPQVRGVHKATVRITSDDNNESDFTFQVQGTGKNTLPESLQPIIRDIDRSSKRLTFTGVSGKIYQPKFSTNLVNWQTHPSMPRISVDDHTKPMDVNLGGLIEARLPRFFVRVEEVVP